MTSSLVDTRQTTIRHYDLQRQARAAPTQVATVSRGFLVN